MPNTAFFLGKASKEREDLKGLRPFDPNYTRSKMKPGFY
jgi:hypothetical protein